MDRRTTGYHPVTRFINHIDVHHSASNVDTVEGIRAYHTFTKGWGEIAYNELIDHDGNLCFGKSDENYPYSTGSFYRDGSGWAICILGLFDADTVPTPRQWATLIKRLQEKAAQFNTRDIKGHRERYANSECPGFSDDKLNQMRSEVFQGNSILAPEAEEMAYDTVAMERSAKHTKWHGHYDNTSPSKACWIIIEVAQAKEAGIPWPFLNVIAVIYQTQGSKDVGLKQISIPVGDDFGYQIAGPFVGGVEVDIPDIEQAEAVSCYIRTVT